jgi:hypothetical protein
VSTAHRSDSLEQREAESLIRAGVEAALDGTPLAPRSLKLPNGARLDVDGVDANETIYVEIFAKQGRLRGAQFHKVARDALKLITLTRGRADVRRIIAFGDDEAAACVTGKSWLAEALMTWQVEVLVVDLDDDVRAGLRGAQARQVMINPAGP